MPSDHERKRARFLRHHGDKAKPVAIVCTNRETHKRVHLAAVTVFTAEGVVELSEVLLLRKSGSGRVVPADNNFASPLVRVPRTGETIAEALNAAATWEFSCPKCGRTPRVRKDWIIDAGRRGAKLFDVSHHG